MIAHEVALLRVVAPHYRTTTWTPERVTAMRHGLQRALDECWPGEFEATTTFAPDWPGPAACVSPREPHRIVRVLDDGTEVMETDAEMDARRDRECDDYFAPAADRSAADSD